MRFWPWEKRRPSNTQRSRRTNIMNTKPETPLEPDPNVVTHIGAPAQEIDRSGTIGVRLLQGSASSLSGALKHKADEASPGGTATEDMSIKDTDGLPLLQCQASIVSAKVERGGDLELSLSSDAALEHPQGRLILGMEAARDLLLAEVAVWGSKFGHPTATLHDTATWGFHRDGYELAARFLDGKIANLKAGG